jgi:hypothetical protein
MRTYRACIALLSVLVILALGGPANADPCGMVPPISIAGVVPIERVGLQKTYVFYKNGIETFVIRPGYRGRVDNFGMLIPFPTPPGIRKVPDEIFSHIAAAVDPPEVVVDLRPRYELLQDGFSNARSAGAGASEKKLKFDAVRVLRQEAIGMYEVAVLEAGSASALNRWMDDHGYKYPKGMDGVCQEYVESSWCFVAVKTRVGQKAGVDPRPGLREVDAKLPPGATFDGNVQAMGFRFEVDEFVVPMRLAAFNAGELRNVVYIVTDVPQRINNIPEKYVVRQIPGEEFFKNLTAPLAVRVLGGEWDDVPQARRDRLAKERDPGPHNGLARALFASDLLAARTGHLTHTFEEAEKELLRISERLLLRGPEIDRLHGTALAEERDKTIASALADLKGMTLTVVDGDFPRDVLARENLTFSTFTMPRDKNKPESYDSKLFGPTTEPQGKLYKTGALGGGLGVLLSPRGFWIASVVLLGYAVTRWLRRRTGVSGGGNATTLTSWAVLPLAFVCGMPSARADDTVVASLVARLSDPAQSEGASKALVALGEEAVVPLYAEAVEGLNLPTRGWAIICLAQIGGEGMDGRLSTLQENARQSELVRTWAAAGRVRLARTTSQLTHCWPPGHGGCGRFGQRGGRLDPAQHQDSRAPADAGHTDPRESTRGAGSGDGDGKGSASSASGRRLPRDRRGTGKYPGRYGGRQGLSLRSGSAGRTVARRTALRARHPVAEPESRGAGARRAPDQVVRLLRPQHPQRRDAPAPQQPTQPSARPGGRLSVTGRQRHRSVAQSLGPGRRRGRRGRRGRREKNPRRAGRRQGTPLRGDPRGIVTTRCQLNAYRYFPVVGWSPDRPAGWTPRVAGRPGHNSVIHHFAFSFAIALRTFLLSLAASTLASL